MRAPPASVCASVRYHCCASKRADRSETMRPKSHNSQSELARGSERGLMMLRFIFVLLAGWHNVYSRWSWHTLNACLIKCTRYERSFTASTTVLCTMMDEEKLHRNIVAAFGCEAKFKSGLLASCEGDASRALKFRVCNIIQLASDAAQREAQGWWIRTGNAGQRIQ